jgi:hypothetical protein
MGSELLQIQVDGSDGLERDVIVTAAMPLFHLHRVLQFCIKPHQSDDTIAGQVGSTAVQTISNAQLLLLGLGHSVILDSKSMSTT